MPSLRSRHFRVTYICKRDGETTLETRFAVDVEGKRDFLSRAKDHEWELLTVDEYESAELLKVEEV